MLHIYVKHLDRYNAFIENIRIPRGKLRNMVRKQRREVDKKFFIKK